MTTLATNCTCALANECPLASKCTISATTGFDLKLLIIIPGIIVWLALSILRFWVRSETIWTTMHGEQSITTFPNVNGKSRRYQLTTFCLVFLTFLIIWPLDMGYYIITWKPVSTSPDKPLLLSNTRTAPAEQEPPPPYHSTISVA